MRRGLRAVVVLGVSAAIVGCGGGGAASAGDTGGGAGDGESGSGSIVVVGENNPGLPPGCKPRRVGRVALTFSEALGSADQPTLERIWSGRFKWFSVTGPRSARSIGPLIDQRHRGFTAYNREDALAYVEQPRGFELRLRALAVSGKAGRGGVDVSYVGLWRELTGDSPRRHGLEGKGFVNCGRRRHGRTIRVWSMGVQSGSHVPASPCPRAHHARGRLVVCSTSK